MLIMLDNAASTDQVVPQLPGSPTCTVLVTSRRYPGGLVTALGAGGLVLDALPEPDAHQLLARHLGRDRVDAEPAAVADLVACCAGLPLALGITAARASRHPAFPLAALAAELGHGPQRIPALDPGDEHTSLHAVLSSSYRALSERAATALGTLSLAPGPDIGLPAAVSLLGCADTTTAQRILRELENASLLQQHMQARYRMHDLVRLYAAERANEDQPPQAFADATSIVAWHRQSA